MDIVDPEDCLHPELFLTTDPPHDGERDVLLCRSCGQTWKKGRGLFFERREARQ